MENITEVEIDLVELKRIAEKAIAKNRIVFERLADV